MAKEKYTASIEMRRALKKSVKELAQEHIKGEVYFYKKGECSCCYGGADDNVFEVNGNIPHNWGSYGTSDGYHKIWFDQKLPHEQIVRIAKVFRENMRPLGWAIVWDGSKESAILIEKLERKS